MKNKQPTRCPDCGGNIVHESFSAIRDGVLLTGYRVGCPDCGYTVETGIHEDKKARKHEHAD